MWMMDEAEKSGERVTAYGMATRLYFLTFASDGIAMVRRLSSRCSWGCRHPDLAMQMLSCALYEVATRPEYIKPLRDEVEAVVAREGWNKDSVSKLYKMDSFLREIHRCYDLNIREISLKSLIGVFVF
jgi:hypothetical protein